MSIDSPENTDFLTNSFFFSSCNASCGRFSSSLSGLLWNIFPREIKEMQTEKKKKIINIQIMVFNWGYTSWQFFWVFYFFIVAYIWMGIEFTPFFFVFKQNNFYINCAIEILNVTINGSHFSKINKNSFDLKKEHNVLARLKHAFF